MQHTAEIAFFQQQGYTVIHQLFTPEEVAFYRDHYMQLRTESRPMDYAGADLTSLDPLKRYPRMLHMHRWDDVSLRWLLDTRLRDALVGMVGREPYAVQTMVYFKPPGARGQALHQDNFYLRVQPGTCIAAWLALDDCDEDNGCMQVVPGSHTWDILCTEEADTTISFTDVTVSIPPDQEVRPIPMQAGDVLFFNGSLVHGSYPNSTPDRFRRSLIAHYIEGDSRMVGEYCHPALRMDGTLVEGMEVSADSSQCGIWVEQDGTRVIEIVEQSSFQGHLRD